MKKIFLAGTALSALVSPAHAGPILDGFLGSDMTWTAQESAVTEGAETYSGLVIEGSGRSVHIDTLQLHRDVDSVTASFAGLDLFPGRPQAVRIAQGVVTAGEDVFSMGPRDLEDRLVGAVRAGPAFGLDCDKMNLPFRFSGSGLLFPGDPGVQASVDDVNVSYTVVDPAGDCLLDMDVTLGGISIRNADGMTVDIGETGLDIYWSLLNDKAPVNEEIPYTADFSMTDMALGMGGAEQARVASIRSQSSLDPASLKALVESGYFEAYLEVVKAEMAGKAVDFSGISVPRIWNAVRSVVATGSLDVVGAAITGDMAQALTGTQLLSRGRTLDLAMQLDQDMSEVSGTLSIDSAGLLQAEADIGITLDEMDEALAEMGPGGLMMSPPLSFREVSLSLQDEGIGAILAEEGGFDPYRMVEPSVSGVLGPVKGRIVADWVGMAREGGASFRAAPDAPMPVVQAFAFFMGDWNDFGAMINAEAGARE